MDRLLNPPLRRFGAAAALLLASLFVSGAHAALDTTALTDDHSVNVPTDWWTYDNLSPQQLSDKIAEHGARIVGLEVPAVTSAGEPRFTARLVHNSGAYAVPGWSWHYDQTPESIATLINANSARLIELERYDRGGGQIRYAAVLVSNTGAARRNWSWLLGVTPAQIRNHIRSTVWRPIDLDAHGSDGARRYNAIFVHNSGDDYKAFEWGVDKTWLQVQAQVESFQGRLTKFGRQNNGNFVFVQVKNTGSNASKSLVKSSFDSITELDNAAHQLRMRPIDVQRWSSGYYTGFSAVLIDNANADERRLRSRMSSFWDSGNNPRGIFSAYLKAVGGQVIVPPLIDLNGQRRAETASSLKVLHLLHAMRQVQLNLDALASDNFRYYDYYYNSDLALKDRCPSSASEGGGRGELTTLEWGLDRMISDSDNRTTRGVVLRYGGFDPINATAAWAGLSNTTLRHNIGCGYSDPITSTYSPETLRNETTAADLAKIFDGVWRGQLLTGINGARREFLESTSTGIGGALTAIIYEEADRIGRSYAAAPFASLVRRWGKGGSYSGLCLGVPSEPTLCGDRVEVRSSVGLIELPVMNAGVIGARRYAHAALISDVPSGPSAAIIEEFATVRAELFRTVIREALLTW
jgi:hypothetical protein